MRRTSDCSCKVLVPVFGVRPQPLEPTARIGRKFCKPVGIRLALLVVVSGGHQLNARSNGQVEQGRGCGRRPASAGAQIAGIGPQTESAARRMIEGQVLKYRKGLRLAISQNFIAVPHC